MARITTALLDNKGYGTLYQQPMVDLTYGGQHGWQPVLAEWVNNQAYVRRNIVAILLEAPKFFKYMPNPEKWVQTLKSLVELHPLRIEGLNAGLEVETAEHAVGGAGEMQREFTNVTRARSDVTFAYASDKYGNPIQSFLESWITYGMMDPNTKTALAGTLPGFPGDMLADMYTMSVLFFEPDPTHRKVVRAWVTTNLFPTSTGEIIGKRDLTSASEVSELSINFGGISSYNLGARLMAQELLDNINITDANPWITPSYIAGRQDADVEAAGKGYDQEAEWVKDNQVGSPTNTGATTTIENLNSNDNVGAMMNQNVNV